MQGKQRNSIYVQQLKILWKKSIRTGWNFYCHRKEFIFDLLIVNRKKVWRFVHKNYRLFHHCCYVYRSNNIFVSHREIFSIIIMVNEFSVLFDVDTSNDWVKWKKKEKWLHRLIPQFIKLERVLFPTVKANRQLYLNKLFQTVLKF